jgi:transposase-like protein
MKYRRFTQDFKRSIVEQLLSDTVTPTELCRRYNISSGQLYTWKRQYALSVSFLAEKHTKILRFFPETG